MDVQAADASAARAAVASSGRRERDVGVHLREHLRARKAERREQLVFAHEAHDRVVDLVHRVVRLLAERSADDEDRVVVATSSSSSSSR